MSGELHELGVLAAAVVAAAEGWRSLGASLLTLYPLYRVETVDERIQALARFKEAAGAC